MIRYEYLLHYRPVGLPALLFHLQALLFLYHLFQARTIPPLALSRPAHNTQTIVTLLSLPRLSVSPLSIAHLSMHDFPHYKPHSMNKSLVSEPETPRYD